MEDRKYEELMGRLWADTRYTIFVDLCIRGYQGMVTKMVRVVADQAFDEGYREGLQVKNKPDLRHDGQK